MLNRWIGILTAALMIFANSALFLRDIASHWMIGDPPPNPGRLLRSNEVAHTQVGIFDAAGRCVGRSWSRSQHTGILQSTTTTVLEPLTLPNGLTTPRTRLEWTVTFREDDRVSGLEFHMEAPGFFAQLKCDTMPSGEFPCIWNIGEQSGTFVLDSEAPRALGDVIRPFDRLPGLYVGQSWRLKLLDPLSAMLRKYSHTDLDLESATITVAGREEIEHLGERVETFVLEGPQMRGWVADDGRVLRQEVTLPIFGTWTLLDEPFDQALLDGFGQRPPASEPR